MQTKVRLGRGLDALFTTAHNGGRAPDHETTRVAISRIQNNPFQPRKTFDADELAQLTASIREHGVLQPIVVRSSGDGYQLIAGERRLRAAQAAGLKEIPVQIVEFDDQQVVEAALAENIQRSDLNPIEKAQSFRDYLDRFGVKTEQLAQRLGLDRTTISNLLNLLNLPPQVQDWVRDGQLSVGHAKVLKGLNGAEKQIALAKETIAKNLSVHALEMLSKEHKNGRSHGSTEPRKSAADKTAHVKAIEDEMRKKLATRVEIKLAEKNRGQFIIGFDTNDDFERIVEQIIG